MAEAASSIRKSPTQTNLRSQLGEERANLQILKGIIRDLGLPDNNTIIYFDADQAYDMLSEENPYNFVINPNNEFEFLYKNLNNALQSSTSIKFSKTITDNKLQEIRTALQKTTPEALSTAIPLPPIPVQQIEPNEPLSEIQQTANRLRENMSSNINKNILAVKIFLTGESNKMTSLENGPELEEKVAALKQSLDVDDTQDEELILQKLHLSVACKELEKRENFKFLDDTILSPFIMHGTTIARRQLRDHIPINLAMLRNITTQLQIADSLKTKEAKFKWVTQDETLKKTDFGKWILGLWEEPTKD